APACARPVVLGIGARRLARQKRAEQVGVAVDETERMANLVEGARLALHPKQLVIALAGERDLQLDRIALVEAGRAADERTVVAADLSQGDALAGLVVERAAIEQGLDQAERRLVVEVVDDLDIALQAVGDLRIETFEAVTLGLLAQDRIELLD